MGGKSERKPTNPPLNKFIMTANIRELTVTMQFKSTGKHYTTQSFTAVPNIRLSGNWLKTAGFQPGDKVKVTVSDGQLIITKQ